ncbi:peroxiredoxin family protein [Microbacterium sp. SSW1-49]|uniref:Peroxiredoxin family protein n=1 Tax=Microbacterium croceum TaxID=2851645 RepID=A0ABT0FDM6_9MICO|nr:redoxin domain-containing protein [Microbacterium croceum]MCK2036153.1 peroxiredoxin family protein [Microbacterium croceum]
MIQIGSVPALALQDIDGGPFALQDHRGSRVLLYFLRAPSCAQCNAAVRSMAADRASFAADDVEIVIVVPTDAAEARVWRDKHKVPFTVVVGRDGTAHAEAGLLRKVFGAIQQSGSVLLDRQGVVRHTHIATNPGASYRKAEVAQAIASLA